MASKRPLLVAFAAMIAALAAIQIISMGKVRKNELIGFAAEPVMFSPVMLNRIYSDVDYKSDPPLSPCAYLSEGVYYEHSYIYPREDFVQDCVTLCNKFWAVESKALCDPKLFVQDWEAYANNCCRDYGTCRINALEMNLHYDKVSCTVHL
eukprot:CAMPEP_0113682588 /NCGR_PEP_ID=MMETSP0038_2-20120614/12763_1 /TAXON_ID=2898 /ORGANISM="Cryptomonas paramecium" /LENGTH=150 /DNA_ID=CAMNT_0000601707 /DNA_START=72 /DNA_END=524 /DNA_ORIENTATION=- /assembly_acc=CAM_ASM_000170